MRRVFLYLTMTMDGYVAGPNNELDWMSSATDAELTGDIVALLSGADAGFIGYPTGSGMRPYWAGVLADPAASKGSRAIARAVTDMHAYLVSNRDEEQAFDNTEVLVARTDDDLVQAVNRIKAQGGRDIGVPGGIRTAQTFVRLGLIDEFVFLVHPVAIGCGKRVFAERTPLDLLDAKHYPSGVVRLRYRPALVQASPSRRTSTRPV
jgi:dihydrofolate reductase